MWNLMQVVRWVLAFIFAIAAGLKLAGLVRPSEAGVISLFDTLPLAARWGLVAGELLLAAWLATGWRSRLAAFATIVLLSVFMGAVIVEMGKPQPNPCGCFGDLAGGSVMRGLWITLAMDSLLLLGALGLYFRAPNGAPSGTPNPQPR